MSISTKSPSKKRARTENSELYLIGCEQYQILGDKLPSRRQVLAVFLHNTKRFRFAANDSAKIVIDEVNVFWAKARINTSRHDHCCEKLLRLYEEWKMIRKTSHRKKSAPQIERERVFTSKLDDLFDIAAVGIESELKGGVKKFLESQRQKGREGSLLEIDAICSEKEMKQSQRREKEEERKKKSELEKKQQCKNKRSRLFVEYIVQFFVPFL